MHLQRQSRWPYLFGLLICGGILLVYILGKLGWIDFVSLGNIPDAIIAIFLGLVGSLTFVCLTIWPPPAISFDNDGITLRSIDVPYRKVSILWSEMRHALVHSKWIDSETEDCEVLRLYLEPSERLCDLRKRFKSRTYFGFTGSWNFDCRVMVPPKVLTRLAASLNKAKNQS